MVRRLRGDAKHLASLTSHDGLHVLQWNIPGPSTESVSFEIAPEACITLFTMQNRVYLTPIPYYYHVIHDHRPYVGFNDSFSSQSSGTSYAPDQPW
jgi:hypothetical protein